MSKTTHQPIGSGHYFKKQINGKVYFYWRIQLGVNKDLTPKLKIFSAKTQKELTEKVKKFLSEKDNICIIDGVKTFADYIPLYLAISKPLLKQSTFKCYSVFCKSRFLNCEFAGRPIKDITPYEVQCYINSLTGTLAPRSIKDIRGCLHAIFQRALVDRLITSNPVSATKSPRIPHKEIRILSEGEINNLLKRAESCEYGAVDRVCNYTENISVTYNKRVFYLALCMFWYSGMRRGECLGLSWDNVDFTKNTIRICRNYQEQGGVGYFDDPKTQNSIRTISMPKSFMQKLMNWKQEQYEYSQFLSNLYDHSMNLVFTNSFGGPVSIATFKRQWDKLRADTRLEGLRIHDIRHNHISWLLGQGVPATEVARRVGDTVETILSVYAHAMPSDDGKTAELLENLCSHPRPSQ